jgi:hypothetical protein
MLPARDYKVFWPHFNEEVWFYNADVALKWAEKWSQEDHALVLVWSRPGAFYIGRFDGRVK